jgi:hypothetical protein
MACVLGFALSCVQETIEFSSDVILSVLDTCLTAVWGPSCEEVQQWKVMEVVAVRAEIGEAETASPMTSDQGHVGIEDLEAFVVETEECWQVRSQRDVPAVVRIVNVANSCYSAVAGNQQQFNWWPASSLPA